MKIDWTQNKGATEEDISRFISKVGRTLPKEHLNLLRKQNGGEGGLALEPMWLEIFEVRNISQILSRHARASDF